MQTFSHISTHSNTLFFHIMCCVVPQSVWTSTTQHPTKHPGRLLSLWWQPWKAVVDHSLSAAAVALQRIELHLPQTWKVYTFLFRFTRIWSPVVLLSELSTFHVGEESYRRLGQCAYGNGICMWLQWKVVREKVTGSWGNPWGNSDITTNI